MHVEPIVMYMNYVLLAVVGRLAEADAIMREYSGAIRAVAKKLRQARPIVIKPLYRGLLVEPEKVKNSKLRLIDPAFTFASFSEDREAGCYFADVACYIAGPLMAVRPKAVGWLMRYVPYQHDVLFHHSWGREPQLMLKEAARIHPLVPEEEFNWNLRSQSEVILTAPSELVEVVAYKSGAPNPTTRHLERRFLPPKLRASIAWSQGPTQKQE